MDFERETDLEPVLDFTERDLSLGIDLDLDILFLSSLFLFYLSTSFWE